MHHWHYLKATLAHKWIVFKLCREMGATWRGIWHDCSKFRPSEWLAHARYFGKPESRRGEKTDLDLAWLKHQKRSKHHWQYWVVLNDNGTQRAFPMPIQYAKEMLADWVAIARHRDRQNLHLWYLKQNMNIHPVTRIWVEHQLRTRYAK